MQHKEVAQTLGLSPRTIENHLAEATRRVGAANAREAARLFIAYERDLGENPLPVTPRVEPASANEPSPGPSAAVLPALQGRMIALGVWSRTAIVVGLTIGLVFSLFLLIAGGETVALVLRQEIPASH